MNSTNINNVNDFIETERKRHVLALNNKNAELINTYHIKTSIDNINTGNYWDILNKQHETDEKMNPMEWDKLNIVVNVINSKRFQNVNVLNIGVGSGNLERLQIKRNSKIKWLGIDISSKSIKRISQQIKKFEFKITDILNTVLGINKYDIVVALEILEHVNAENVFNIYNKIHKCIKKNGLFILSIPINEGLEKLLIKGENPNAHVRVYTKEIIYKELEINGFYIMNTIDLFAFHKFYRIKKIINQIIRVREPNGLLIIAKKP